MTSGTISPRAGRGTSRGFLERRRGLLGSSVERQMQRPVEVGDERLSRARGAQQAADAPEQAAAAADQVGDEFGTLDDGEAGAGEIRVRPWIEDVGFPEMRQADQTRKHRERGGAVRKVERGEPRRLGHLHDTQRDAGADAEGAAVADQRLRRDFAVDTTLRAKL